MPSDIDLVNKALAAVGENKITSLDNTVNSKLVQTANFFLPVVKRAVLRAHDWNCARRRATLTLLGAGGANDSLGEWTYMYRLPTDCLAVRRFVGTNDYARHRSFAVELDSENKPVLYCDVMDAAIVYTMELLDVNRWDPLLYEAAATRLASEFACTSPRDMKFVDGLWQFYKVKLEEAVGVDETEGGIAKVYGESLLSVRYGGY